MLSTTDYIGTPSIPAGMTIAQYRRMRYDDMRVSRTNKRANRRMARVALNRKDRH
jgi:hypothetical protein